MTEEATLTLREQTEEAKTITFFSDGVWAVKLRPQGVVELNPVFTLDETAARFWDAVKTVAKNQGW